MRKLHIDFLLFTLQSYIRFRTLVAAGGGCGLGGLVNEAWWVWQGQLSRPAVHIWLGTLEGESGLRPQISIFNVISFRYFSEHGYKLFTFNTFFTFICLLFVIFHIWVLRLHIPIYGWCCSRCEWGLWSSLWWDLLNAPFGRLGFCYGFCHSIFRLLS